MDQQDILEFMGKFSHIISVIGFIVVIVLIWYKITGHSPTADQIIITFETAILAAIFGFIYYFADFKGATQSDVRKLREEASDIKRIISQMQLQLMKIEVKLSHRR
ncbi:hypothetical protein HYY73_04395 [Candidatus Woesearchaeota archaeon]|nr:hypothetical protein [Candidatus Woesearchaeota archaeon]